MTTWLAGALAHLPVPDGPSAAAVRERAAGILRPPGALAALDEVAEWVAGWHGTTRPAVNRPAALIFAADHGVAAASVSSYPSEVTAAMLAAYRAHQSTITALATVAGATVDAVDVGVGRPTGDIRVEPAMDAARFEEACAAALEAVNNLDADLLVIGEMGIGNTTVAAAVTAAICGGDVQHWVGRGTGVDAEGLARKRAAVNAAVHRVAEETDPLEILRQVGGAELVAMAAAVVAARHRRLPVVLDGYVVCASALAVHAVRRDALDHCVAGHCSAEPGHRLVLDRIGKRPLLDLKLRLGEGSGAMAAVPLIRMACAGISQVPTFTEWFG